MGGWIDGWMQGSMGSWPGGYVGRCVYGLANGCVLWVDKVIA